MNLTIDGETNRLSTNATNVRELLDNFEIDLADADLVEPPLFTPLTDGLDISITRVTESIEVIERSIPFQRRSVRNESMNVDDPPLIVQSGNPGLQEITVRIVYHDGIEYSRQETKSTIIEPAQDEIVMVGVGLTPGSIEFPGQLAYISGGSSVILRGSSAYPEQLDTGGDLDQRVFTLSPDGRYLLFTQASEDPEHFNTLWVIDTSSGAVPKSLNVENVLWADWNPARVDKPQIAYTTGLPTKLLPGWEANNDLWLGDLPLTSNSRFRPERIIEAYPATYGWWGGNYSWSPTGQYLAYSYADEVGLIRLETGNESSRRVRLAEFPEYNTRADWVWVPSLSWSPDGEYLAFSRHSGSDIDAPDFDTWVAGITTGTTTPFVSQTGIWGHPHWAPNSSTEEEPDFDSRIAFLRATNPLESQRSSYTLWLMDRDGSNAQQIYPAAGENSRFPREQDFMEWGPFGREIAFIYDDHLYMFDTLTDQTRRITHDDNIVSNPTWAPYGSARDQLLSGLDEPASAPSFNPKPGISPLE